MTLLLTGAYGQLGKEIIRQAPESGVTVVATDIDTVDITDSRKKQTTDNTPRSLTWNLELSGQPLLPWRII